MDEDDTARALRKIPYADMKNLVSSGQPYEKMSTVEKAEFLEKCGWTQDELVNCLFEELNAIMYGPL